MFFKPYIIVPLYLYPSPGAWAPLYNQIDANPNVHFQVIVNPSDGPGTAPGAMPEQNWVSTLSKLNSKANVDTIGYVHVEWGARDTKEVCSEIDAYAGWSAYKKADIHVDGIFFDETPATAESNMVSYMNDVSAHARQRFPNRATNKLVFNPGTPVPPVYYDMSDAIVAFEDDFPRYSTSKVQSPMCDVKAPNKHKSIFMINNFAGSQAQQKQLISGMIANNFTGIWISTLDDYSRFSAMWPQLVQQIASMK